MKLLMIKKCLALGVILWAIASLIEDSCKPLSWTYGVRFIVFGIWIIGVLIITIKNNIRPQ